MNEMIDIHRGPFTKQDVDGMPADTALQNLVAPTQNLSSSFKRACQKAREKYWTCARPAKSEFARQGARMRKKPINRVIRAYVRSIRKLNKLQKWKTAAVSEGAAEAVSNLMAPLIAVAVAARNEVGQRARSIQLYTAYKLIKAAERAPDKFNVDEINAAKQFLLKALVPQPTQSPQPEQLPTP